MEWKKASEVTRVERLRPNIDLGEAGSVEQANAICQWREDLIPRMREAALSTDFRGKLELVAEGFELLAAVETFGSIQKVRALVTVMKNRAGL